MRLYASLFFDISAFFREDMCLFLNDNVHSALAFDRWSSNHPFFSIHNVLLIIPLNI